MGNCFKLKKRSETATVIKISTKENIEYDINTFADVDDFIKDVREPYYGR